MEPAGGLAQTPLERIGIHSMTEVEVTDRLTHLEAYTADGLLTVFWHGDFDAPEVVVCCSGATGGLLGPAGGLWHRVGVALAERGIGTVRFRYRNPQDPSQCILEAAAVLELAAREGARRAVTLGHSFGGAVAIRAAVGLPGLVVGVATYATQSGGCEAASRMGRRPLVLFHGDKDRTVPLPSSALVAGFHGRGDVVVLPGAGHDLIEVADDLLDRTLAWVPSVLRSGESEDPATS